MKKKLILPVIFLCLFFYKLNAQHTISGYIKDQSTGEILIGANIFLPEEEYGTSSNSYGYYVLEVDATDISLVYSYIGYQSREIKIQLDQDTIINISLMPDQEELSEVVITDSPLKEKFENVQMSFEKLDMKQVKNIPVLFGEVDLIKVLQLKPGVQSGNEGSSEVNRIRICFSLMKPKFIILLIFLVISAYLIPMQLIP